MCENFPEKRPADTVESFMKVNFESHASFFARRVPHSMDCFLVENDIVCCALSREKTTLMGSNQSLQQGSDAIDQNLG